MESERESVGEIFNFPVCGWFVHGRGNLVQCYCGCELIFVCVCVFEMIGVMVFSLLNFVTLYEFRFMREREREKGTGWQWHCQQIQMIT